jgi:diacylglycerol kinase family enzyme
MGRSAHFRPEQTYRVWRRLSGFLIVNPRSGGGSPSAEELAAAATERGLQVHVMRRGEDPYALASRADADALGMAGGDGSLALVAKAALERDLPLVCIPFGTRNHFARDLGLDRDDPIGALDAFGGDERRIDVAWVNERPFLNNVSLGMYARLVHQREHHRRRRELFARLRAIAISLRRRRPGGVTLDGAPLRARVILVSNNAYTLDLLSLGERERLDEGLLHLYAATGIVRSRWVERSGTRFAINATSGHLRAAVDGEPERLDTPLEFRIDPGALRVLLPPGL